MKDDKYFWNYNIQPGLELRNNVIKPKKNKAFVSIITSYYNAHEYMEQTINCVLNQTFPYWEWIIVDDGSTNIESINYLDNVKKIDNRIKIYHKENEGLAKGRDYAIKYATTDLILPLDADDLIEPTFMESLYWSLKTNEDASWAFSNSLGFGKYRYLVDHIFDSEKMKTENQITATAIIRKNKILELGGYSVAKRYVNEDWHLWLRMLANGDFPIQASFYGFWYRRRESSLLTSINDEKKRENELRLRDLKIEADKIEGRIYPIVYPNEDCKKLEIEKLKFIKLQWNEPNEETDKEYKLYIMSNIKANNNIWKKIKIDSIYKNIIIILLEENDRSNYVCRQKYEKVCTVFDLTTFIEPKYYLGFIDYVITTRSIKSICVEKKYEECIKNTLNKNNFETIKNKNNICLYKLLITKYKIYNSILGRVIRKIMRFVFR